MRWYQGNYFISTDNNELDLAFIHNFLSEQAYWSKGIPLATVKQAVANSLCFGLYCEDQQIGFARMVTDKATFAYLADVFITPDHRGHGLAKWLMECIHVHPELQGLRRLMLATADAHGLYRQFGYQDAGEPEQRLMLKLNPDMYLQSTK
jgi:GNAT superfamily N-acetyltransferase